MSNNIIEVEGFAEGNTFIVDGPMWYDGTAQLLKFNESLLELHLEMKATDKFGHVDFVIKDGSVNLEIKLDKPNENYRLIVADNNNNGKQEVQNDLKIEYGETSGGLFSGHKKFVKASNEIDTTTFTLEDKNKISIKTTALPISVDLIKN